MSTMQAGPDRNERTLGQLVASATQDFSTIIRGEIALAKAEVSSQFKKAGLAGVLLAAAGVIAFYSVYFIFITIAEGITAAGLPRWLSYLIDTVFFLLVAGVLAFIGIRRLKTVQPKPTKAIESTQQTVAALKRATSNPYVPAAYVGVSAPATSTPPTSGANPASGTSPGGSAAASADSSAATTPIPTPAPRAPGSTTTDQGWEGTASDALASDTGDSAPADLTDHPVMHSAPSASTAALPRTRAEAKAEAEARAKAEKRHGHHPEA